LRELTEIQAPYGEAPANLPLLLDDCRVRRMSLVAKKVAWFPTKELKIPVNPVSGYPAAV